MWHNNKIIWNSATPWCVPRTQIYFHLWYECLLCTECSVLSNIKTNCLKWNAQIKHQTQKQTRKRGRENESTFVIGIKMYARITRNVLLIRTTKWKPCKESGFRYSKKNQARTKLIHVEKETSTNKSTNILKLLLLPNFAFFPQQVGKTAARRYFNGIKGSLISIFSPFHFQCFEGGFSVLLARFSVQQLQLVRPLHIHISSDSPVMSPKINTSYQERH